MRRSSVVRLMSLVCACVPHDSWRKVNDGLQRALHLAVACGARFNRGDLEFICKNFRGEYWMGASTECWYTLACTGEHGPNLSACQSYEAWLNRKPFILKRQQHTNRGSALSGSRLCVGSAFDWKGQWVEITSFAADGQSCVACSYKPQGAIYSPKKVLRRHRITLAELREANAAVAKGVKGGGG